MPLSQRDQRFFATSLTKEISAENCNRFWTLPICIESRYHRFHWLANETNTFSTVAALRIMFFCVFLDHAAKTELMWFNHLTPKNRSRSNMSNRSFTNLEKSWKIIQLIPYDSTYLRTFPHCSAWENNTWPHGRKVPKPHRQNHRPVTIQCRHQDAHNGIIPGPSDNRTCKVFCSLKIMWLPVTSIDRSYLPYLFHILPQYFLYW